MLAACGPVRQPTDQPALTVVEAGTEPRRPLRYFPGAEVRMATTSRSIADATITNTTLDTLKQRLEFPLLRKQLSVAVGVQHGELELTARVDDVSISADGDRDPAFRARFEVDVAKEKGTTRTTRFTPTGVVTNASQDHAPPALMIRELLTLTSQDDIVRFPDQSVGVRAVWRITSHPRLQGVQWHGIETVRLTAMTDEALTLETDAVLTGPPQDLAVQPGSTSKLNRGAVRTTRKLTVPLRGLARTVYGESSAELDLVVFEHGRKITSSTRVNTVYTENPVP
jgi:hypothetical protein